ncbi:molybdopterin-dependent oxidoreductase [Capillimicrobium parvum]|uniref:molybdopterin-dependent oxidoreductase n=1 Tax=Capillimicrobium parvum TaxID=2884022 RepID=UPI00216B3660|nr:molybdopterin-dependent oxidoreductase [Capillimicrobium parvum]
MTAQHWGRYVVTSVDGRIVSVEPVAGDPEPSSIGYGMVGALEGDVRITRPMVREGWLERGPGPAGGGRGSEPFVEVSWDRALDLVADQLRRVHAESGGAAVYGGSYGWGSAGRFHHPQSQLHRFLAMAGGYTDSVGSYSVAAMEAILPHVIGGAPMSIWSRGPLWSAIAADGELVVCFGGLARKNADINPGGVGRHESAVWQRRCRAAGVRFVNVSPLADDVDPDLNPEWVAIRPGTDAALMLALSCEIVRLGLHDRDFLERWCTGADVLIDHLLGRSDGILRDADWASSICDVEAHTIRSLARRIATCRTVVNASWSIQRQRHGEQTYWAAVALAAVSGSLGRPGGGLAAGLGITQIGVHGMREPIAAFATPGNPVEEQVPVARIADALLHPGTTYDFNGRRRTYPHLRLVYWAGGNPFHHHQDLNRLVRAWQQPETVVVHDSFWNPLCKHADIVLPVATSLERDDLAIGIMDPVLTASPRAVEPPDGVRTDYAVLSGLAARLGFEEAFTEGRDAEAWVRELYERTRTSLRRSAEIELPSFDAFWEMGEIVLPTPPRPVELSFEGLRSGLPLDTPSGRIELFSETIASFGYDDCPGHPTWLEPEEWLGAAGPASGALHLLSNQPRTRLHSQYDHGSHSRGAKVQQREPVRIHPDDAAQRGIADGDVVLLHNDRGRCLAGAVLDDRLRRGVIVLSTGAWYDAERPGGLEVHGNPNVLTADIGSSKLAQGPTSGNTLVWMERFAGRPPVRAFSPPSIRPHAT